MAKAQDYGWANADKVWLLQAGQLSDVDQFFTPGRHAENLRTLLTHPADQSGLSASRKNAGTILHDRKVIRPTVLISELTPRDILGGEAEAEEVFWWNVF